jgi:nitrate reductase alpha subunit
MAMAAAMEVYTVPTKQGDDETMSATIRHLIGEEFQDQQYDDAFSRYSNDFIRMKSLLLHEEEDDDSEYDDDLDALARINQALRSVGLSNVVKLNQDKRRRGNNSAPIKQGPPERKTRLTWELHPDLLLHDLIEEFEALDNGAQRIVDEETESPASEKKETQSP